MNRIFEWGGLRLSGANSAKTLLLWQTLFIQAYYDHEGLHSKGINQYVAFDYQLAHRLIYSGEPSNNDAFRQNTSVNLFGMYMSHTNASSHKMLLSGAALVEMLEGLQHYNERAEQIINAKSSDIQDTIKAADDPISFRDKMSRIDFVTADYAIAELARAGLASHLFRLSNSRHVFQYMKNMLVNKKLCMSSSIFTPNEYRKKIDSLDPIIQRSLQKRLEARAARGRGNDRVHDEFHAGLDALLIALSYMTTDDPDLTIRVACEKSLRDAFPHRSDISARSRQAVSLLIPMHVAQVEHSESDLVKETGAYIEQQIKTLGSLRERAQEHGDRRLPAHLETEIAAWMATNTQFTQRPFYKIEELSEISAAELPQIIEFGKNKIEDYKEHLRSTMDELNRGAINLVAQSAEAIDELSAFGRLSNNERMIKVREKFGF